MERKINAMNEESAIISTSQKSINGYIRKSNQKRLFKTDILGDFVRNNNGTWDNVKWIHLCEYLSNSGHMPIDLYQVFSKLEQERKDYFSELEDLLLREILLFAKSFKEFQS